MLDVGLFKILGILGLIDLLELAGLLGLVGLVGLLGLPFSRSCLAMFARRAQVMLESIAQAKACGEKTTSFCACTRVCVEENEDH